MACSGRASIGRWRAKPADLLVTVSTEPQAEVHTDRGLIYERRPQAADYINGATCCIVARIGGSQVLADLARSLSCEGVRGVWLPPKCMAFI